MAELRPDQIETLRWMRVHGGTGGLTVEWLANSWGITERSARRRLERLEPTHVESVHNNRAGHPPFHTYRPTNAGLAALEKAGVL